MGGSQKTFFHSNKKIGLGRGSGQLVSVLAFNSDNPSSNPAKVYSLIVQIILKERQ